MTCPCCIADRQRDRVLSPEPGEDELVGLTLGEVGDFCGEGSECGMDVELPPAVRRAVEAAPSMVVLEPHSVDGTHPDQWSENDERSLMVLGRLDRDQPPLMPKLFRPDYNRIAKTKADWSAERQVLEEQDRRYHSELGRVGMEARWRGRRWT